MNDQELDSVYSHLCRVMTQVGEPNALLFLSRFALLAIDRLNDSKVAEELIAAAADEVS